MKFIKSFLALNESVDTKHHSFTEEEIKYYFQELVDDGIEIKIELIYIDNSSYKNDSSEAIVLRDKFEINVTPAYCITVFLDEIAGDETADDETEVRIDLDNDIFKTRGQEVGAESISTLDKSEFTKDIKKVFNSIFNTHNLLEEIGNRALTNDGLKSYFSGLFDVERKNIFIILYEDKVDLSFNDLYDQIITLLNMNFDDVKLETTEEFFIEECSIQFRLPKKLSRNEIDSFVVELKDLYIKLNLVPLNGPGMSHPVTGEDIIYNLYDIYFLK